MPPIVCDSYGVWRNRVLYPVLDGKFLKVRLLSRVPQTAQSVDYTSVSGTHLQARDAWRIQVDFHPPCSAG